MSTRRGSSNTGDDHRYSRYNDFDFNDFDDFGFSGGNIVSYCGGNYKSKFDKIPDHKADCDWELNFWSSNKRCTCGLFNYKDGLRLWIDDTRLAPKDYDIQVKTATDAVIILIENKVSHVSFDYNLESWKKSGEDIIAALIRLGAGGNLVQPFSWSIHCGMYDNAEKLRAAMATLIAMWGVDVQEIITENTPKYEVKKYGIESMEEWRKRNRAEDERKERELRNLRRGDKPSTLARLFAKKSKK